MRTWNAFAGTVLLALVAAGAMVAAPINPTKPPAKAAPTFLPVVAADTARGEVTYEVSICLSVPVEETRVVEKDGRKETVTVIAYRTEIRTENRQMLLNSFNPITADGKPLAQDDFARRVVPGAVLLVAWDGEMPEAAYLKLFKPDTVILVAKRKPGEPGGTAFPPNEGRISDPNKVPVVPKVPRE